jgi:hypothetical protein
MPIIPKLKIIYKRLKRVNNTEYITNVGFKIDKFSSIVEMGTNLINPG